MRVLGIFSRKIMISDIDDIDDVQASVLLQLVFFGIISFILDKQTNVPNHHMTLEKLQLSKVTKLEALKLHL